LASHLLQQALAAIQLEDFAGAEALILEMVGWQSNVNALQLLARIKLKTGQAAQAVTLLQSALAFLAHPALLLSLGNAYHALKDIARASACYQQVLAQQPKNLDALFNLGLCKKEQAQWLAAAHIFAELVRLDPHQEAAVQHAINALAELANSEATLPTLTPVPAPTQKQFSVIICSIDAHKFAQVSNNFRRLIPAPQLQLIGIHDARGLSEAYNRGIAQAHGDIVIFAHDDIEILNDDFVEVLSQQLADFDAVGVAGTTKLQGPAVFWSGNPYARTFVTQLDQEQGREQLRVCANSLSMASTEAQALDGVFIAVKSSVLARCRFDESISGFHFYDLAFSYQLFRAGFRLGVVSDIRLIHASRGNFGAAWQQAAQTFLARYPELDQPRGRSHMYNALVNSRSAVRRFYALLGAISNNPRATA
jgi:tetratricopeptide (TPR) repeat protein